MGVPKAKISYIIPVLNSHEIIRRQAKYLAGHLTYDWELIVVDDGSDPPIEIPHHPPTGFSLLRTNDTRKWTQPRARNIGAKHATGDWLVLIDVDHILLPECIESCEWFANPLQTQHDYMSFQRRIAALDEDGNPVTELADLAKPPWNKPMDDPLVRKPSPSACMVRADIYHRIGGYDERFCGRYGSDDGDFNRRYLRASGKDRHYSVTQLGLFPNMKDPAWFHGLERVKGEPKQDQPEAPVLGVAK